MSIDAGQRSKLGQVHALYALAAAKLARMLPRPLGFPIKEIDELLKLWRDKSRPSRKVRALADRHKQAVVARMQAHRSIIKVLTRLIEACKGDDRPDCPILDELGSGHGRRV